jgi:formylglycine-generating enzyme required for sulfatase activity
MSDIFISYKREEQAIARNLANALESEGWSVWWDPRLRAGERFNDVIEKALKESKCVVVMWSKLSVESLYVKDEATYALKRNKLVPVMIEEVDLPFRFEELHTPSLRGWDGSKDASDFRKLVEDIAAIVGSPVIDAKRKADEEKERTRAHEPEMVEIPRGTFRIGDDRDKSCLPVHAVRIVRPFAIGQYEVTFEEYDRFARSTGRELPHDEGWGRGQRPVINVSWNDAVEYAKWLSAQTGKRYRLPSEAEWEYAARSGGKDERWAGTSREQELGQYAWYQANRGDKTQPVGSKKSNRLGLYDMSGNVWEWVQDCWHNNYDGAPTDGSAWGQENDGDCSRRVIRGGSWYSVPADLLVSSRGKDEAGDRTNIIGFRLAQDID